MSEQHRVQQARGVEYGEVTMGNVRAYLESLSHEERCVWLGGFIGYVAGAAGGLVGGEVRRILLSHVADICDQIAADTAH